jgi:hypothetical protein
MKLYQPQAYKALHSTAYSLRSRRAFLALLSPAYGGG